MSIPRSEAFAAFSIRNHTARTPADVAALNPINPLTINLTDVAWARVRVLTAIRDGGLGVAAPTTLPDLHEYIRSIVLPIPIVQDPFEISSPDWNPLPAWAAGGAATRAAMAQIRFLSLVPIASLEITSGPMEATAKWTLIAKVVGALGPVGTQASRACETSQVQGMASLLRRHTSGGPEDGALARNMKADLLRAMLPKQLRAHTGGPDDQGEELSDSFAYKISDADRLAVEQKRFDLIKPW